jgi:hypothetical protein
MKSLILAATLMALPVAALARTAGLLERGNRVELPGLKLMSGE